MLGNIYNKTTNCFAMKFVRKVGLGVLVSASLTLSSCPSPLMSISEISENPIVDDSSDNNLHYQLPENVAVSRGIFEESVIFNTDLDGLEYPNASIDDLIDTYQSGHNPHILDKASAVLAWNNSPNADLSNLDRYDLAFREIYNDVSEHIARVNSTSNPSHTLDSLMPGGIYTFGARSVDFNGEKSDWHTSISPEAFPARGWYVLCMPENNATLEPYLTSRSLPGGVELDTLYVTLDNLNSFVDNEWETGNATNLELSVMIDLYLKENG